MNNEKYCKRCGGAGVEPNQTEIAAYLSRERIRASVLQKDMAKALGISPQYLADLEKARRPWSADMRKRYSEELRKDIGPWVDSSKAMAAKTSEFRVLRNLGAKLRQKKKGKK